jgi:hypothetical protein
MAKLLVSTAEQQFYEATYWADRPARLARSQSFKASDVRNTFFTGLVNVINLYATSIGLLHLGGRRFAESEPIKSALAGAFYGTEWVEAYAASHRKHLFLDAWFLFEDALRVLYSDAVPITVQEADRESARSRFKSAPPDPHIDIMTMWARLVALSPKRRVHRRTMEKRRKAVEFWAATRNTIHSNTFYLRTPKELRIGRRTLKLERGKPTDFHSVANMPRLLGSLVSAFCFVRQGIRTKRAIRTPANQFGSPYTAATALTNHSVRARKADALDKSARARGRR